MPKSDSLLEFPCSFPVKVFGADTPEFEALISHIIRRHVAETAKPAFSRRSSRGGRYVSITVTFIASSREQLDALYAELSGNPQILMAL
jgi:putative lipoic acid-binding regulatory protein